MDSSTVICRTSAFFILGVSGFFCRFNSILFADSVDPDQMPHDVASDMVQHCLPRTLLRVSR